MTTRRRFIGISGLTGAGMMLPWRFGARMAKGCAITADPAGGQRHPQVRRSAAGLDAIVAGTGQIELQMTEFQTQVLPTGMPQTWVWGYLQPGQTSRASYLGPVIVATRGRPPR